MQTVIDDMVFFNVTYPSEGAEGRHFAVITVSSSMWREERESQGRLKMWLMAFRADWDHGLSLMLRITSQDQILSFNVRADDGREECESDTESCPWQRDHEMYKLQGKKKNWKA